LDWANGLRSERNSLSAPIETGIVGEGSTDAQFPTKKEKKFQPWAPRVVIFRPQDSVVPGTASDTRHVPKKALSLGTFEELKEDLSAVRVKFLQVFSLIQNHCAMSTLPNLTELLAVCGCPSIVDLFESRQGIDEILSCMASVVNTFVAEELLASPGGFSVAFDDSKDVSGWEEMIVSGNYVKMDRGRTNLEVKSRFLALRHVPKPTGLNLGKDVHEVHCRISEKNLEKSSVELMGKEQASKMLLSSVLNSFDADGASANQSEDKGAKAYLAEQFPEKPFNWCGGHK